MDPEKQAILIKLGKNIASIRKQTGLSQRELGYRCGKDQQTIHKIETGKNAPNIYVLYQLAEALGIRVRDLINF